MASRLAPCPSCSRHVKVGPPTCPFCGGEVPTDVPARVSTLAAGKPLTRAALLFAGAAAVSACSSSSSGQTPEKDAEVDTDGSAVALYGVAVIPDAEAHDTGSKHDSSEPEDAGTDLGHGVAAYGVFISPDAEAKHDSGEDAGHGVAAYGVAVQPDGSFP